MTKLFYRIMGNWHYFLAHRSKSTEKWAHNLAKAVNYYQKSKTS